MGYHRNHTSSDHYDQSTTVPYKLMNSKAKRMGFTAPHWLTT